jgi:hypothetical protein
MQSTTASDTDTAAEKLAKLKNPNWRVWDSPKAPSDPKTDEMIFDALEQFVAKGEITIMRTFLPERYPWQVSYQFHGRAGNKAFVSGGGATVREAMASMVRSFMEEQLGS